MMSILLDPMGRSLRTSGSEIPESALLSLLSNPAFTETSRFVGRFFPRPTPSFKVQYQTVNQLNALHSPRGAGAILLDPLCEGYEPTRTRPRNDIIWSERANRHNKHLFVRTQGGLL